MGFEELFGQRLIVDFLKKLKKRFICLNNQIKKCLIRN